jgi:shikimate 5-dehydrogenase
VGWRLVGQKEGRRALAVIEHLDKIAPDAAIIGAVNTVRRERDRLIGENTDGKGFLRGVRSDAGVDPRNQRVSAPAARQGRL